MRKLKQVIKNYKMEKFYKKGKTYTSEYLITIKYITE